MAQGKQKYQDKNLLEDSEKILEFKALGFIDQEIRKKMNLDRRRYDSRLKYIFDSGFFKQQALNACLETVHRMLHTRKLALNGYKDCQGDSRRANAAASYLKVVREIDNDIPNVAAKLGFIPKIAETVEFKTSDEYKEMPIDQLMEAYKKATA